MVTVVNASPNCAVMLGAIEYLYAPSPLEAVTGVVVVIGTLTMPDILPATSNVVFKGTERTDSVNVAVLICGIGAWSVTVTINGVDDNNPLGVPLRTPAPEKLKPTEASVAVFVIVNDLFKYPALALIGLVGSPVELFLVKLIVDEFTDTINAGNADISKEKDNLLVVCGVFESETVTSKLFTPPVTVVPGPRTVPVEVNVNP